MAQKLYDITATTGHYKDQQGQDKTRYENVGEIYKNDKGYVFISLKRHFNPAGIEAQQGRDRIFLPCFPPKQNNNSQNNQAPAQQQTQNVQSYNNENFTRIDLDNGFPEFRQNIAQDFPPF